MPDAGPESAPVDIDCRTATAQYYELSSDIQAQLDAAPELAAEVAEAAAEARAPKLPEPLQRLYDKLNALIAACPFEVCTGVDDAYAECLAAQAEDVFTDSIRTCPPPPLECESLFE
jgi:hypothetical protein